MNDNIGILFKQYNYDATRGITLIIVRCYVLRHILCQYTNCNCICEPYYVKLNKLKSIITVIALFGINKLAGLEKTIYPTVTLSLKLWR